MAETEDPKKSQAETPSESAKPGEPPRALPEIDFATFVLSLGTSVLLHLGELTDPDGKREKNVALAKQTIDMIGMLQDKTRGNLTEGEDKLLASLLYDLRVKYVDAVKKG
jgi:hypothetical protein